MSRSSQELEHHASIRQSDLKISASINYLVVFDNKIGFQRSGILREIDSSVSMSVRLF